MSTRNDKLILCHDCGQTIRESELKKHQAQHFKRIVDGEAHMLNFLDEVRRLKRIPRCEEDIG